MKGNPEGRPAGDYCGRAFTVEDVRARQLIDLRAAVKPELWEQGVRAMRARADAESSLAQLHKTIHITMGAVAAFELFRMMEEAAKVPTELPAKKRK